MANINDLGRLIANAVKAGLQDLGGASSGGATYSSSNVVMPKPTFTTLYQGSGNEPPYGAGNVIDPPFANSGSAGGRPSFSGMALTGLGATVSAMPGPLQANFVNYANTRLAGMFPPGSVPNQGPRMPSRDDLTGRYNRASEYVRELSQRGTITNSLDVYSGIANLSATRQMGIMGDRNLDPFFKGSLDMTNLVPGAGATRTMEAFAGAFGDPTRQNRMMMMGIQVNDPVTGRPKSPVEIADQIWNKINTQKLGSSPLTKEDIQRSLLPGRSLHSMLNQIVGDDDVARSAIAGFLIAKAASGGKSASYIASKKGALELGFTTEGMLSASNRSAAELGGIQSVARAETYGLSKANEAAGILAESLTRLNNLIGFASPSAGITGFLEGLGSRLFGGGKAAGGATSSSNAYLVGEMGPELFVPKTDGYVVPNHELRFAGARHEGGFVHPHPHPSWSSSDLDDKGRLNSDKIKEMLSYAGFKGGQVGQAMSIIGAESARRPGAEGDKDLVNSKWGPSVGLFQIRSLKDPRKYSDPMRNANYLDDPIFNVMAGYEKSKGGTDWGGWTTAKNLGLDGGSSGGSTVNTVSASSGGGFMENLARFMPSIARNMMGMASGNVTNYGGVKVEIILPANAKTDGKSLAKQLLQALDENNLKSKAKGS